MKPSKDLDNKIKELTQWLKVSSSLEQKVVDLEAQCEASINTLDKRCTWLERKVQELRKAKR